MQAVPQANGSFQQIWVLSGVQLEKSRSSLKVLEQGT
jgi:hypothetical protein